ncbi:MAG: cation:proton antiporter [Deltaproteobacteria bacterium]|nr:cation:proton antiporter [Deltaproteobacteria bacterium]
MNQQLLKDILVIFAVSIPVVLLLRKGKFPVIIGFLITGALIGQQGIGLVSDTANIHALAEFGLALLLFSVGLEFSFEHFGDIKSRAIIAAFLQITLTFLCGWLIGWLLHWPTDRGIYFGCVLSLSSSAVVMTVLLARRMTDSVHGKITTTILIIQDLAFIPMIVLLPLVSFKTTVGFDWVDQLSDKAMALVILACLFIIGKLVINYLLKIVTTLGRREVFVITVIMLGLGASWLTARMNLSFALGSFMAGLLIGFTEYRYQAISETTPFRFCFNSLFFCSIGMLLDFGFIIDHILVIAVLLFAIPLIKMLVIVVISMIIKFPLRIGIVVGISLAQIGEFSFLIVHNGYKANIIGPYLHQLIIASAVFSMMISPLLIYYAPKIASLFDQIKRRSKGRPAISDLTERPAPEFTNHVIVCGFGPLGKALGQLLDKHHIPFIVLELNPKTIQNIKKQDKPALYGDGTSAEILYKSGIENARLMAITVPDFMDNISILRQARELNPKIQIITRAKFRSDVAKLYHAGSDVVISEELEGGIEMARYALEMVGVPIYEVERMVKTIRDYGSADFFN